MFTAPTGTITTSSARPVLMDTEDQITLTVSGGSRRDSLINELVRQIASIVEETPGVLTGEIDGDPRLGGKTENKKAARRRAIELGYIETVTEGASKHHFRTAKPFPESI